MTQSGLSTAAFRKSTHFSGGNNCAEVAGPPADGLQKSSYGEGGNAQCVEALPLTAKSTAVRDSKAPEHLRLSGHRLGRHRRHRERPRPT
ncbi:DUF397 domain-containing protein [Streptomyces sp. NPDC059477]|uniref:DUF397 domain-containing protein n=1 Tax=Streptomyces sp. NPDC059477 TaxID=3346847 RepID=UPI0036BA2650